MEQLIINDKFRLTLTRKGDSLPLSPPLYPEGFSIVFYLSEGRLEFGRPVFSLGNHSCWIECRTLPKGWSSSGRPGGECSIDRTHAIQLLELLREIVQPERDMVAVEVMIAAICSSVVKSQNACGATCHSEVIRSKVGELQFDFLALQSVYSTVQEWKSATKIITVYPGDLNLGGLHPRRFAQLLNFLYNTTPAELIHSLNMKKAVDLLVSSDEQIASVSERLGYAHKENFITAFRNSYGVTPGQLRRRFRVGFSF